MIETVAAFLEAIRVESLTLLADDPALNLPGVRPSIIGDAYEELTSDVLEVALPPDLDLRVVTGQIRVEPGAASTTAATAPPSAPLSGQIDVMVVVGDGQPLGGKRHWLYPVGQVLAVLEVKKTLTVPRLASAHALLNTLGEAPDDALVPPDASRAFQQITGRRAPADRHDVSALPLTERFIFYALLRDATTPARVVVGHGGYKSAATLRDALLQVIGDAVNGRDPGEGPRLNFGPSHLPDLIACGPHALAKLNGMPIASRLVALATEDGVHAHWPCYGLSSGRFARLLLEVLWTRIVWRFRATTAELFPGDLDSERPIPFLFARPVRVAVPDAVIASAAPGAAPSEWAAWVYAAERAPAGALRATPTDVDWEPPAVTPRELLLLEHIARATRERRSVAAGDPGLRSPFTEEVSGTTDVRPRSESEVEAALGAALQRLSDYRLVGTSADGRLRPLVEAMQVLATPDAIYVADLEDPRLPRWVERKAPPGLRERMRGAFKELHRRDRERAQAAGPAPAPAALPAQDA